MRILLIEDDKAAALSIQQSLDDRAVIDLSDTGEDGLYQAEVNEYDVIVLDLGLPDMTGFEVCQEIRNQNITTPILILTASSDTDHIVSALDLGADDFLTKPFSLNELHARIRALHRRNKDHFVANKLEAGDLILEQASRSVTHKGQPLSLRRKEYLLLEYLMRHIGKVVTRDMLFEHVWGGNSDSGTNTVDVHIKFLRDKVDKPFGTKRIKTVHGLGYKFEPIHT